MSSEPSGTGCSIKCGAGVSFHQRFGRRAGNLHRIGQQILIFKDGKKYLPSNNAELDSAQVKRIYGLRQQIEEVFRLLKQEFGWGTLPRRISSIAESAFAFGVVCFSFSSK